MMNSMKKRKNRILDSSSDDDESSMQKTILAREKSKKKKRIILDSDEEDNEFSINDIKKNAKARAKKLSDGKEKVRDSDSKASSENSNKTSSTPKQKNNILNYFQLKNPKKNEISNGANGNKIEEQKIQNQSKIIPKTSVEQDPDFTYTQVISKSKFEKDKNNEKKEVSVHHSASKKEAKIKDTKVEYDPKVKTSQESPKTLQNITEIKREVKKKKSMSFEKPALPRIIEPKKVSELWVDKYKPSNTKQIVGQQGDKSPLNKLIKWLKDWQRNFDKKPGFGKWAPDDGAGFKATLLSGPPGVGKTTSAKLVCQELGYDFMELNASDSRNKKSLNENVKELLRNTKLTDFFKSSEKQTDCKLTLKHCIIMDEVDGMSGNEDRGGVAELIQLIKTTKIPLICICNDRGDQKMRSLVNYCFDLRFHKPKLEQIKAFLMSIAFKENIKVSPDTLSESIISSNYDIRQSVHNLSMLAVGLSKNNEKMGHNERPTKDIKLGPFDAIKKVFSTGQEYALMSFNDKSDLFFCDYSIMPLFVYENYISVNLSSRTSSVAKQLKRVYKSIDSISHGDIIEKEVRSNQAWSLLPLQAAFASVMPGAYMRSSNGLGFPQFPQFMGKLSTTNKNNRTIDELTGHMSLAINGSKLSFILDYIEPLRKRIIDPLLKSEKQGLSSVLDLLEHYSLVKDDMDSILEYCLWAGEEDPMKKVDSKSKAALTRAYNKKDFALPYATNTESKSLSKSSKKKSSKKGKTMGSDEDDDEDEKNDHDDDKDLIDSNMIMDI